MNTTYPLVTLHHGKDNAVRRFHPWIFSGAIKSVGNPVDDGDVVEVFSDTGEYLATGHYAKGSIAVRIFSFKKTEVNKEFWKNKIFQAYQFREQIGLTNNPETNVYRLVHAEGDGLPGLVIDIYNDIAVIQAHSVGMFQARMIITEALQEIYNDKLKSFYFKSSEILLVENITNGFLAGKSFENFFVIENGSKFYIDFVEGQKTGFFIDQRENRKILMNFCKDKKVLNTFCYTGGFSVFALKAGARQVHSVDSSKKAVELAQKNIEANSFDALINQCFVSDTLEFLKNSEDLYDVIILDPPAYAKRISAKHNAVQGYKRLNAMAIKKIKNGGIIFTFSCSQIIDRKLFTDIVTSSSIESGRQIQILYHLSQPADHPVSIFHPEGEYLKGLVLRIT